MASINGVKVNNSYIPLLEPYAVAGVDPATKQPVRSSDPCLLKTNIKKTLRINDEQTALNSVKWYNLPKGIDSNLIERILYYRGQGMFFHLASADQFFFLPYSLDGNIDVYGRFTDVTPLPFNGTAAEGDEKKVRPWVAGLKKHCVYDTEIGDINAEESCVLLHDYSCQISQTNISRQILNDPIIDLESDMLPFARTSLLNSTGVTGMRVSSQDEQSNVEAASNSINKAALAGKKYVAVIGNIDFQEMTGDKIAAADQFLMTMQSIDNFRLSLHGVDGGGIFQKQAHMLESENEMNASKASFAMQDRLYQRKQFCDLINKIWGLNVSCEAVEQEISEDAVVEEQGNKQENEQPEQTMEVSE